MKTIAVAALLCGVALLGVATRCEDRRARAEETLANAAVDRYRRDFCPTDRTCAPPDAAVVAAAYADRDARDPAEPNEGGK